MKSADQNSKRLYFRVIVGESVKLTVFSDWLTNAGMSVAHDKQRCFNNWMIIEGITKPRFASSLAKLCWWHEFMAHRVENDIHHFEQLDSSPLLR